MHEAFLQTQVLANVKMFMSDEFAQKNLGRDKAISEVDMEVQRAG